MGSCISTVPHAMLSDVIAISGSLSRGTTWSYMVYFIGFTSDIFSSLYIW